MPYVTVNVTEADIQRGYRESCTNCPVARALRRTLRTEVRGLVSLDEVIFSGAGCTLTPASLPDVVRAFIADFDDGKAVRPICFNLEIPEWAVRPYPTPIAPPVDDWLNYSVPRRREASCSPT